MSSPCRKPKWLPHERIPTHSLVREVGYMYNNLIARNQQRIKSRRTNRTSANTPNKQVNSKDKRPRGLRLPLQIFVP